MAGNDCAGIVEACAMRVARLDADGAPLVGATNAYVSDALVSLAVTPVYAEGTEHEQTNGCGVPVVSYKAPDKFKRVDLRLEFATPDPELQEILVSGFTLLTNAGDTVGFQFPRIGTAYEDHGVSMELWSAAIVGGDQDGALPWWRSILAKTKNWRPDPRTLDNSVQTTVLLGQGLENPGIGDGPVYDFDTLATQALDAAFQMVRDTDVPTTQCGYIPIAAEV